MRGCMPVVDGDGARFALADPSGRLAAVRLVTDFDTGSPLQFARSDGQWQLRLPLPRVRRMEYLFELTDHNGHRWTICDPENAKRAPGAFGDKSVLRFPAYREPSWLTWPRAPGRRHHLSADAPALGAPVTVELWAPRALRASEPAPLLLVHDGPEFATLGRFTACVAALVEHGDLPPLRAALLGPADRNGWYSANPRYAEALAEHVLPILPAATVTIGVGVSLGALAMLHAHQRCGFDGLLLQSGSFFTAELDPQERAFPGFAAVSRFVASVPGLPAAPVPTVLTCGVVEENLANNRAMTGALCALGYPARLVEVPDAHNFVAWRDALHPHLTDLVTSVAADRAA
jgi:enterochelin esterase family protein